eukprot:3175593-Prymnesium_polylepis.1
MARTSCASVIASSTNRGAPTPSACSRSSADCCAVADDEAAAAARAVGCCTTRREAAGPASRGSGVGVPRNSPLPEPPPTCSERTTRSSPSAPPQPAPPCEASGAPAA